MFLALGLVTVKFTLFEIVTMERIKMISFHPSYKWWKNPEPEVLVKVYIFNITNSAEFIAGTDDKLKLQEVGPITYREILEHDDVVRHDENSTMSYTVHRRLVYKESANVAGILNQTVFVPNMAGLAAASYTSDNMVLRHSFNFMMKVHNTSPIVKTQIYNYFWNLSDPVL